MAIKQSVNSPTKPPARRGRPPQSKVAKATKTTRRPRTSKTAVEDSTTATPHNNSTAFDLQAQLEIQQKALETQAWMMQEISQLRQQLAQKAPIASGDNSSLLAELAKLQQENKELREKASRLDQMASLLNGAEEEPVAPKRRGRLPKIKEAEVTTTEPVAPKRRGRVPKVKEAQAATVEVAAPKRRGRVPKVKEAQAAAVEVAAPKRRGRIPNKVKEAQAAAAAAPKGKPGRKPKVVVAPVATSATMPAKRGRKPKAAAEVAPVAVVAPRKNAKAAKNSIWQEAANSDIKRTYKSCWPVVFKIEEWNQKNPTKLAKISQTMLNKSGVNFSRAKGFIDTYANVVQDYHDQIGLNKANSGKFNEVYEFIRSSLGKGRK